MNSHTNPTRMTGSPCSCGGSSKPCSCGGNCGCDCGGNSKLDTMVRPRFFAGQLLTEDDLQSLENYVLAKNRLHNRHLFGTGVVCGLEVLCKPCDTGHVTVQPGYALDCCGNDIVLDCSLPLDINAMIRDLRRDHDCGDPCTEKHGKPGQGGVATPREYCLYVSYCEQESDPVSPYAVDEPCGTPSCQASRIREGIRFELRCPPSPAALEPNLLGAIKSCFGDVIGLEKIALETMSLEQVEDRFQAVLKDLDKRTFDELRSRLLDLIDRSPRLGRCDLRDRVLAVQPAPPAGAVAAQSHPQAGMLTAQPASFVGTLAVQPAAPAGTLAAQQPLAAADKNASTISDVKAQVTPDVKAQTISDVKVPVTSDVKAPVTSDVKAPPTSPVTPVVDPTKAAFRAILLEILKEGMCMALNPPCAPCDDTGVLLACLKVIDCKVIEVCNLHRRFVMTPVALRYWSSFGIVERFAEKLCCGATDQIFPALGLRAATLDLPDGAPGGAVTEAQAVTGTQTQPTTASGISTVPAIYLKALTNAFSGVYPPKSVEAEGFENLSKAFGIFAGEKQASRSAEELTDTARKAIEETVAQRVKREVNANMEAAMSASDPVKRLQAQIDELKKQLTTLGKRARKPPTGEPKPPTGEPK